MFTNLILHQGWLLHNIKFHCIKQVRRISQVDIETEIVFNCQMGRGRTTTGMVIATLVYLNRIGASGENIIYSGSCLCHLCRSD